MGSLIAELARQAPANARREVDTYVREIPELGAAPRNSRVLAETLEYSVWLRRRTIELAPGNALLTDSDLGHISTMGASRAAAGMSLESRQRILRVHTALMLREINEATENQRGGELDELMRIMAWFAPQGERGIGAYCRGFVSVLRRRMPYVEQVAQLVRSLLTDDPLAEELARAVGLETASHYMVTVIRAPAAPADDGTVVKQVEALVRARRVPAAWVPGGSQGVVSGGPGGASEGGELIALVPAGEAQPWQPSDPGEVPGRVPAEVSGLLTDFADALALPCAAGVAGAARSGLAEALDRARRISAAAPLRTGSARVRPYTVADVFAELAVADVPFADAWLETVAVRLDDGPDLLRTLDAYYRHDMNRTPAAASLNVHPRTLDYRLRRVRELTGLDPASTHGVRTLTCVVTRRLSGAWT
ncbi:PucR family transcriptional regulator [Streptomyces sp. NPDC090106]|uniref:PucR family transcriptional regulator n=1 Tax=Streptomyces sp. NPDC090106 TaxID=3365946 RepID=UPI003801A831